MAKKKGRMEWYDWVAFVLMIIGSLNWGLVGFGFNLVEAIFGTGMFTNIIYWAVGASGLYGLYSLYKLSQR